MPSENNPLAVVVFAYNRPRHLERCLNSLEACAGAEMASVFIYCDGPRAQADQEALQEVVQVAHRKRNFKSQNVILREKNLGLGKSVIAGVTEILESFSDRVIVLEDDLILAPSFLDFLKNALEFYESDKRVLSLSAFNFPPQTFKLDEKKYPFDLCAFARPASTGWATWRDRWTGVDWEMKDYSEYEASTSLQSGWKELGEDLPKMLKRQILGQVDSWAVRWAYHHFKMKGWSIYPVRSMVDNIGWDGSGVHSRRDTSGRFQNDLRRAKSQMRLLPLDAFKDREDARRAFQGVFARGPRYYFRRALEIGVSEIKMRLQSSSSR